MDLAPIAEVRAYWEALRDGRAAPFRSELDPRGIERSLEHAFVLERIAPRAARFRLAGMHLNDLAGMEVRGMPFSALFGAAAREEVERILESVFSGPRTAEASLLAEAGTGRPGIAGHLILLPLRSDLGDVSRALGCLVSEGLAGHAPRRFGVGASLARPIAVTKPDLDLPAAVLPAPPAGGFADPAARFTTAGQSQSRDRGHLRLVGSDE